MGDVQDQDKLASDGIMTPFLFSWLVFGVNNFGGDQGKDGVGLLRGVVLLSVGVRSDAQGDRRAVLLLPFLLLP